MIVLEDGAKIEMRSVDRCGEKDQVSVSVGFCGPLCACSGGLAPAEEGARRWLEVKKYIERKIEEAKAAKEAAWAKKLKA